MASREVPLRSYANSAYALSRASYGRRISLYVRRGERKKRLTSYELGVSTSARKVVLSDADITNVIRGARYVVLVYANERGLLIS